VRAWPALAVFAVLERRVAAAAATHPWLAQYSQSAQRHQGAIGLPLFGTVTFASPGAITWRQSTQTGSAPRSSSRRIRGGRLARSDQG
jgi:hypothetical protein